MREDVEHLAETLELAEEVLHRALHGADGLTPWSAAKLREFLAEVKGHVEAARVEALDLMLVLDKGG